MMCDELTEAMAEGKWSLRDKVIQLKGVVDLHERNKEWTRALTDEIRKKRGKEIRELRNRERNLRLAIEKYKSSNKEGLDLLLRQDPHIEHQCRGKSEDVIEDIIRQFLFARRKEYDRLIYDIGTKEDLFLKNQFKLQVMLMTPESSMKQPALQQAESIQARIESLRTRIEAISVVNQSYDKIRRILRRESQCFDTVLSGLHMDAIVQCKCIVKAMELGQMALEDEAALKERFNKVHKEYRLIEKEKQQMIDEVKKKTSKARKVHTRFLKSDSHTRFNTQAEDLYTKRLFEEEVNIKQQLNEVKQTTSVITPNLFFPRMYNLKSSEFRLHRQLEINDHWFQLELTRRNSMEAMTEKLLHTITDNILRNIMMRKRYVEETEKYKKKIEVLKGEVEQKGKLLLTLQMILLNLYKIIEPVNIGAFKMEVLDANLEVMERRVERIGDEAANASTSSALNFLEPALPNYDVDPTQTVDIQKMPMDICQLLDVICAKIHIVRTQIGDLDLSASGMSTVFFVYQCYMKARAAQHLADIPKPEEVEDDDLADIGKSKLPSREEMKERSKKLVEQALAKPKFERKPSEKVKKHVCY